MKSSTAKFASFLIGGIATAVIVGLVVWRLYSPTELDRSAAHSNLPTPAPTTGASVAAEKTDPDTPYSDEDAGDDGDAEHGHDERDAAAARTTTPEEPHRAEDRTENRDNGRDEATLAAPATESAPFRAGRRPRQENPESTRGRGGATSTRDVMAMPFRATGPEAPVTAQAPVETLPNIFPERDPHRKPAPTSPTEHPAPGTWPSPSAPETTSEPEVAPSEVPEESPSMPEPQKPSTSDTPEPQDPDAPDTPEPQEPDAPDTVTPSAKDTAAQESITPQTTSPAEPTASEGASPR